MMLLSKDICFVVVVSADGGGDHTRESLRDGRGDGWTQPVTLKDELKRDSDSVHRDDAVKIGLEDSLHVASEAPLAIAVVADMEDSVDQSQPYNEAGRARNSRDGADQDIGVGDLVQEVR